MLNAEEARAIYQLLNRVTVNGQEAETLVALKSKLASIANGEEIVGGQPVFKPTEELNTTNSSYQKDNKKK